MSKVSLKNSVNDNRTEMQEKLAVYQSEKYGLPLSRCKFTVALMSTPEIRDQLSLISDEDFLNAL